MSRERTDLPVFVLLILGVGAARFVLSFAGVGNELVRYASMTAVIVAATVWFGSRPTLWRRRLRISYALVIPYMLVETAGLGYTWLSGRETIFQAPEYALDFAIEWHLLGHVAGGLTWEPFTVFAIMSVLSWAIGIARGA